MPQSGKSTYANAWVHDTLYPPFQFEFEPDGVTLLKGKFGQRRPRAIVGGDDFRHAVHGHEYLVEAEGMVFAAMDVAVRALLRRGHDVVIDETCTTQSTLLRYLKLDIDATPVFIEATPEVCKARAEAAGRGYLLGPIDRMHEQLVALKANWHDIVVKLKEYIGLRKGLDVPV